MGKAESNLKDAITQKDPRSILAWARQQGFAALDEQIGKTVLSGFGVSVPKSDAGATPEEVRQAALRLKPPFAVKVLSSQALHKSDLGGVRLGLKSADEAAAAADSIQKNWPAGAPTIEAFLVEEMAPVGQEIVIGGFLDPQFGPILMVGFGGVYVEIFADVTFRICPISRDDAVSMLDELTAKPLLDGARGQPPLDQDALIDALLQVGGADGLLVQLQGEIAELDINPLIVSQKGAVAVDALIVLSDGLRGSNVLASSASIDFAPLFRPKTVAVAGVSSSGIGPGNRFIANLRTMGYSGEIYPIHPKAETLEGLTAYRSLGETPQPVDYAYIAVPKDGVADLLKSAKSRVQFAQIMTSGFGEGGANDQGQDALMAAAREGGVRILGPNSLGTHSPKGGITFIEVDKAESEAGCVGVVSQSGGIGIDFVRTGQGRGIRYSGVVTVGNSADIGPNDLLEYFINDPDTSVIGMYLEDIGDGRRFFDLLRAAQGYKPVVLLKGGRSRQGQKAVMSHTGALAGDFKTWRALSAQTGCVLVDTIEDLLEFLLLFQTITPSEDHVSTRLALFGNGGGASVVATDCFVDSGFDLAEFSDQTSERLKQLDIPDGASTSNPIDFPANAFNRSCGKVADRILPILFGDTGTDAILLHLNLPVLVSYRGSNIVPNIIDAAINHRRIAKHNSPHLVIVMRSDGSEEVDSVRREQRRRAVAAGVPVFDDFAVAAKALGAMSQFESFHKARRNNEDRAA
ncbi:acetate--CoA ligase family protein [Hwanghaeella sp. 1Z406]|uniref:acetate--CoA ligase family protein n=1 Tax=Hwanghaeella sp. 1Z406 TaxID=3402811 RepID=UPI003B674D13